ncbi:hypothetical protein Dda_0636 [Drechslerella dactyloides]|uniref:Uncharacterized protein n=1 Tax=Drechslerella dactyloides TaxID=74499 RepID=A0AAD6NNK6_DREDA|nr:hypothetical protein Dda_0636 [Drechslerella dactyloides]
MAQALDVGHLAARLPVGVKTASKGNALAGVEDASGMVWVRPLTAGTVRRRLTFSLF